MGAVMFWLLAVISVLAAGAAITRRNPLASALALAVCLIAVAGLLAMLSAHLLFILQILVYAGAIVVLIVFVIMLLNLGDTDLRAMKVQSRRFGAAGAVCLLGCLAAFRAIRGLPDMWRPVPAGFGTASAVATSLFGRHLVSFELVGLILLIGILGAVVLAKKGE